MGEGPSFSPMQRLEATTRLVEFGLPADRMILGIGAAALADQAWLGPPDGRTRPRRRCGNATPFFRDVNQEGVYAFYAALPRSPRRSAQKRRPCCSTISRRSAACRSPSRRLRGFSTPTRTQ